MQKELVRFRKGAWREVWWLLESQDRVKPGAAGLMQVMLDAAPQPVPWSRAGIWLLLRKIALQPQLGAAFSKDPCSADFHEKPWEMFIPMP